MIFHSKNPTTWEIVFQTNEIMPDELNKKIEIANNTFHERKEYSFERRKELLNKLWDIMESNRDELAKLDTIEMWMLYKDAKGDVSKSVSNIRYFAEKGESLLQPKSYEKDGLIWQIIYEPLGVIFSIMPWNYPFNQALRSSIPNIMAGNTVILKHASNVPQVAQKIEELFHLAWFPEGVYTNLFIDHRYTETIISNDNIKWVNITWSEDVGRLIGSLAWRYLKPSILELWWNDAFVVLETSNIDKIIDSAIKGRFSNNGQKCNSSKRFIVIESMYETFCNKLTAAVEKMIIWDPFNENVDIWPLAKESAVVYLDKQVQDDINAGARLLIWWKKAEIRGNYYLPTILVDVIPGMRTFDEETFGPVAVITKAKNIKEIIDLINASKFWLWCSVFGDNKADKLLIAKKAEVGNVFIDKVVTSYAFLPYWWIKNTWYGKELWEEWLKGFVNAKVIVY